jgi:radical SAM superfamily enzyme YgiQ (UPF0313 family)
MKIYLIKASAGSSYSEYKAETGGPPQNIFSAAAAIPENMVIEMCDETIGMKTNFESKANIVAIFMSTPDAYRAYEIADSFQQKGKIVLLGGLHTFFLPEEAKKHADAIIIGESEGLWEEIISDVESNLLKPYYRRSSPFDLANLKPYPTHIIPISKYQWTWSVIVTRGCPMHCSFCLVHQFFDKFHYRPIENIVEELKNIKALGVEWVELHSDNLTHNRRYALELFRALAPLKMKFYGETTVLIAKDKELLKAAQEAGLRYLLLGIETSSEEALKSQGKDFVKPHEIKKHIATIKSYGISVMGDFLFGFDEHRNNIFDETIDFIQQIDVDIVYPHLVIPFPGSDTFRQLDQEKRILTKDWSKYDGAHAVFEPKNMSKKELEQGTWKVWKAFEDKNNQNTENMKRDAFDPHAFNENEKHNTSLGTKKNGFKWKTYLALLLLIPAIYFDLANFMFGALFLYWSLQGIKQKEIFFVEPIKKQENPILFWCITILWIALSLWSVLFFDYLFYWINSTYYVY